jgi:hypothetical protein
MGGGAFGSEKATEELMIAARTAVRNGFKMLL